METFSLKEPFAWEFFVIFFPHACKHFKSDIPKHNRRLLNYWSTNHCWTQGRMYILLLDSWKLSRMKQTKDVRMYIEEYLF